MIDKVEDLKYLFGEEY